MFNLSDYSIFILCSLFISAIYLVIRLLQKSYKNKNNYQHLKCNIIYVRNFINYSSVPIVSLYSSSASSVQTNPIFIIDSGCSQPMCRDKSAFSSLVYDRTPVHLANGSVIYTQGKGSIGKFHDIFYVPDLDANLLSVSYLNRLGFNVQFLSDQRVYMQHQSSSEYILIGCLDHTTALFTTGSSPTPIFNYYTSVTNSSAPHTSLLTKTRSIHYAHNLWHQRFCHINDAYVNCSLSRKLISGIDIGNIADRDFCESCAMTKSHYTSSSFTPGSRHQRKRTKKDNKLDVSREQDASVPASLNPIFAEDNLTLRPLQKFACDLKGPLPSSINNNKYCLIFTCLRTRYRFVYFLKSKDETVGHTKSFIHHVRTLKKNVSDIIFDPKQVSQFDVQSDTKLSKLLEENQIKFEFSDLKSDNGGEFTSDDFETMLLDYDINHQTTSPHTPHQNGVAERTNRTVFEAAAACLHAANLGTQFWTYAVKQVVHTLNRMPCKRLQMESTPYSHIFNRIPDVSYFRTFGCDAYLRVPDIKQPALGLRSVKGIFVGYDHPRSLSYIVFHKGRFYKSHHVSFNEDLSTKTSNKEPTQLEKDINDLLTDSEAIHPDNDQNSYGYLQPTYFSEPEPDLPPVPDTSTDTQQDPSADRRTRSTRSQLRQQASEPSALFSNLSKITLSQGQDAILSGKYYDPDDEFALRPERAYMSCGTIDESDALDKLESDKWNEAMLSEISKLSDINTWDVIDYLPQGRRALKHKWVLKTKFDIFGNFIYKARLTVKGCSQREGYDFDETFSPVAHLSSIRLLLSLATAEHMHLWQLDVANAFANAHLTDDVVVYMEPPPQMGLPPGKYLKLNRALYGLKQASREWNQLLAKTLVSLGFKQCISDACLFVGDRNGERILVSVYVDDLLLASRDTSNCQWLQSELSKHFKTNATVLNKVLGFGTQYDPINGTMLLSKDDYTMELVNKYNSYISDISYRDTPIDPTTKFSRSQCPAPNSKEKERMSAIPYRQLLGALNYLSLAIRADITFSVHYLARFMDNPAHVHWLQLLNVLAYLRDHPRAHITYSSNPFRYHLLDKHAQLMAKNSLYVYVDADFASSDIDSRKSVTGYLIYFNGGLISWRSGLQKTVSSSSTEAEYKALHEAAKEAIWLSNILNEIGYPQQNPIIILEDNENVVRLGENPIASSSLKHIDTVYHQTREFFQVGKIVLILIPTLTQLADMLTKALTPSLHDSFFRSTLTVYDSERSDR